MTMGAEAVAQAPRPIQSEGRRHTSAILTTTQCDEMVFFGYGLVWIESVQKCKSAYGLCKGGKREYRVWSIEYRRGTISGGGKRVNSVGGRKPESWLGC